MKIILEAEGVKRELRGPFNLCASAADLHALRDQIDFVLNHEFCYGWITIFPKPISAGPSTTPRPWAE